MDAKQLVDLLYTSATEVVEVEANLKSVIPWETRDTDGNIVEVSADKQRYRVAFEVDGVRKTAFVFRNAFPENKIPRFDRTGLPVTVTLGAEPVEYTTKSGEVAKSPRVLGIAYDISALNRNAIALMANRLDF